MEVSMNAIKNPLSNEEIFSIMDKKFSYKDKPYRVIGVSNHKCPITREWYEIIRYEALYDTHDSDYSREAREFLSKFVRI